MRDYQAEDMDQVINYNSELWILFLGFSEKSIKSSNLAEDLVVSLNQSLDLIRAINSYRSYRKPSLLFESYPELIGQKDYVELLWKHFDNLNNEELSDLAIEMIHEVCSSSP